LFRAFVDAARRVGIWVATLIDHRIGWHRLPVWLGLLVLVGIRSRLRLENLTHTSAGLPGVSLLPPGPACRRSADGTFNDLTHPTMGSASTPLGRNVPLDAVQPETFGPERRCLSQPSPRTVSNELLARRTFEPAGQLNVLAAAWIQFMIHDWFSHGPTPGPNSPGQIEIPVDDPRDRWPRPMRVPPAAIDRTAAPCARAMTTTYLNTVTHWWDGSQMYGSDAYTQRLIRTGPNRQGEAPYGRIQMDADNPDLLPLDPRRQNGLYDRADLTGFNDNWWIGLSLLHTLFALEHNAICEYLRRHYPRWSGDDLYAHARLINAAVMAKIHTIEWTPAILDHPTVAVGMRGSWQGLAREPGAYFKVLGLLFGNEVKNGILNSPTEHDTAPYSITEEFVSVYRMHALLPDQITLRSRSDPRLGGTLELRDVIFGQARDFVTKHGLSMADVAHSLAVQSAGALTLHNFPKDLREVRLPNEHLLDLAAVDIFRDRERGVPRYNDFRRLVHRPPVESFGQLVGREGRRRHWDDELQRIYGHVDSVDLMVGLYAEPKPRGFGFSDTAFRIFLLMAGRRLKSDRFFTADYTKEVYTAEGLDWIERRTMAEVIAHHLPDLRGDVGAVKNPFHRWDWQTDTTPHEVV
jgi:Animal haem peroxidase